MQICAISHLFNGFVPVDTKSLFLTFNIEKDEYDETIKEVKSRDFNLLSAVIHGQIRKDVETPYLGTNEKYIRSRKYRDKKLCLDLLTAHKYDKKCELSVLNKDMMKLICRKIVARGFKDRFHWKLLAVENFVKFENVEKRKQIKSWNLFPIEDLCLPLVKLLHKTLSYIIKDVWLLNESLYEIYLRKTVKPKRLVLHFESEHSLIFEKCTLIIQSFMKNYII